MVRLFFGILCLLILALAQGEPIQQAGPPPFVGAQPGLAYRRAQAAGQGVIHGAAKIKKVDAASNHIDLIFGGQVHTVRVSPQVHVFGQDGKALDAGLKAKELTEGTDVMVTAMREDGGPVVQEIRIGRGGGPGSGGGRPISPDTSRLVPLTQLGTQKYQGYPGGLYPDGKNERPPAHEKAGLALARKVEPLDVAGRPSADGKIVLLSVGMSNTVQAFSALMRLTGADREVNPRLVLVNGAQGGMTAFRTQDPDDHASGTQYWTTVDEHLKAAGVTREQVQAVWIKQADAGPTAGFPPYAQTLEAELAKIVQILPKRFPNIKLAYLSSRTYGGYATTPLNPEPYAYESGFSVKWLIERQIQGDTALNYDPAKGPVKAPWLSWAAYLWANGSRKRADGFRYEASDFAQDGTHESPSGQQKVGNLLLQFFKTDPTTRPWFLYK